jgi:beta-mannosidase
MNDAWPSISFSSIDYYGRWKPLQYLVKRLYTNIAIFTLSNNTIVAINDNLNQAEASVKIVLMYFNGTIIFK